MYTPHTDSDIAAMLAVTGAASLEELVRVPDAVALKTPLDVPPALPEIELARKMSGYAARNAAVGYRSFARSRCLPALRSAGGHRRLRCAASF